MWAGLLYEEESLCQVEALCADWQHGEVDQLRAAIARDALGATFRDQNLRGLAESLLEIAQGGLRSRANLDPQGRDETIHLEPIVRLIAAGRCPADDLREAVREAPDEQRRVKMIEASRA
jgi:glutamate--cysteine ligase